MNDYDTPGWWRCRDGTLVQFANMDTQHILNVCKLLVRWAEKRRIHTSLLFDGPLAPTEGTVAHDELVDAVAESELEDYLPEQYNVAREELRRRCEQGPEKGLIGKLDSYITHVKLAGLAAEIRHSTKEIERDK